MKMKRVIAIMSIITMALMGGCSANGNSSDSSATGLISQAPAKPIEADKPFEGKYFDTDIWEAVPMISQELIDAGYENSEACQTVMYITLDPIEGKLGYFGSDVGGVWRTKDGGKSWHPCNIGYEAYGGVCSVIDPYNINRAIMVGATCDANEYNGLHLTTNGGDYWRAVYMPGDEGFDGLISSHEDDDGFYCYDSRIQLAYDETSYSEEVGGCAVVYWSREDCEYKNDKNRPALYKSTDGGESWSRLEGTEQYAGGYVVVHPEDGRVAVGNEHGAWISSDGGESWSKCSDMDITSLIGIRTRPDMLYAMTNDGLYVSSDFGGNFTKVTQNMPTANMVRAARLRVSPADPNYMMMFWAGNGSYNFRTYYSHDGGVSWNESAQDKSGMWIPVNSWNAVFCYSPVDKDYILSNERCSTDGGKSFFMSTKGFNAILVGGKYSININNERYMSLASQDFNGGYSTDGGKTWTYINWSGLSWGGFVYGSYCIDDQTVVAALSPGWWTEGELVYTKDGGKTIVHTGLPVNGPRVGYAALGKENICFLSEYRTDDYCESWTKMDGCTAVFEHDPETGRLFGCNKFEVVYSDDDGVTWNKIAVATDKVEDIAYNNKTGILYVCAGGRILSIDMNNENSALFSDAGFNISYSKGICLDPENPNIMYVIHGNRNSNAGVMRSLDGGKTWTQLGRRVGDGRDNCPDAAYGSCISFCESTREIFIAGDCRGVWKMDAAPADASND